MSTKTNYTFYPITLLILGMVLLCGGFCQCNCEPNISQPNNLQKHHNPPDTPPTEKPLLTEITNEMIQAARKNNSTFLAEQLEKLQKEDRTNHQIPYIDDTEGHGISALEQASSSFLSRPDIVKALLERGAKKLDQALYAAVMSMPENNIATITLLLDAGASPMGDQSYAPWPFYQVIRQDATNIVKLMLPKIPNINMQNFDGDTALHIALEANNKEITALLLNNHANADIANKRGETPRNLAKTKMESIRILFGLP